MKKIVTNVNTKFLVLDEESNAIDYLTRSLDFLEKIEKDKSSLKWFIIAFHGAVHSFMLLTIYIVKQELIFKDKKVSAPSIDRTIINFQLAYAILKDKEKMKGSPFVPSGDQDICMKELNDNLRNLMVHFRPMVWASEPWYPARACYPLIDILEFCINNSIFRHSQKPILLSYTTKLKILLEKYKD